MFRIENWFPPAGCLLLTAMCTCVSAENVIHGQVLDLNGRPLAQAMVSAGSTGQAGVETVTVFSDAQGTFVLPAGAAAGAGPSARKLGYEQVEVEPGSADGAVLVMRRVNNQAAVAPASAWMARIDDVEKRSGLILDCTSCHQIPAPEVRAYAGLIAAVDAPDARLVREQSWSAIVKYMNFLFIEEFSRGDPAGAPPDPHSAYAVGSGEMTINTLADNFTGPMESISGYDYGAPLAVNEHTIIREFEVPGTNNIREALLLGKQKTIWAADVSSDRIIAIDPRTGKQRATDVPADVPVAPHSMHRGADGSLWVTPLFNGVIGHLDPDSGKWRTWKLRTADGVVPGIHDLSFGAEHTLLTDEHGRIWFSDIVNNAVGYFDPDNGKTEIYPVPDIEGRPREQAQLYGLVMTSDRKHIWYSQLGIGSLGCFNIATLKFETLVKLPSMHAGPRRLSIDDDDIMYVPLFGAGQLVAYDTRARKLLATYDLPDRAAAPYAVTWDPRRRVVWIPTSNADAIYRFDPQTRQFGVIPMPRQRAFLRMLDVDPETGMLITSYANILTAVRGPRMAVLIDPGDNGGAVRVAASGDTP